jgi:hypothetical protein
MLIDLRAGEMKILEASLAVRHSSITQCLGRFPDTGRLSARWPCGEDLNEGLEGGGGEDGGEDL